LLQGSLFDRRSEQQSHARETAVTAWRQNLGNRIADARAMTSLSAVNARLIAAWALE
jgi:hypothetical protein